MAQGDQPVGVPGNPLPPKPFPEDHSVLWPICAIRSGLTLALLLFQVALAWGAAAPLSYEVLVTTDHDRRVFTQGLILKSNVMTESSGLYGKSFLMQYDVGTGAVLRRLSVPQQYFAEGITEFDGHLYMLTWQAGLVLVFDAHDLQQQAALPYEGEGWGITHNGQYLITSNGSDILSMRRANDFAVVKSLQVKDGDRAWNQLNELEFAEGLIWANVWQESVILGIDPESGAVKAIVDLHELVRPNHTRPGQSVLNGIAYDPEQRAFWITGKWWPKRYLVRFHWPSTTPPPSP
jgi:glutamine cyclotransferase